MPRRKKPVVPQKVRWKRSSRAVSQRPDAEVAYQEIERITKEHGGKATAEAVLEDSKRKNSPLHQCFDWDNKSASNKWRLHQARELMNSIEVVILQDDPRGTSEAASAPAFVSIERGEPDGAGYRPITIVMDDADLRDRLIQQAWRDLQSWVRRYEHLNEFAQIHSAIRNLKKPA